MNEIIELITKTYGLVGLLLIAPFVAVVVLWRHQVFREKEWALEGAKANDKLLEAYKLRVDDAQKISVKLTELNVEGAESDAATVNAIDKMAAMVTAMSQDKNRR